MPETVGLNILPEMGNETISEPQQCDLGRSGLGTLSGPDLGFRTKENGAGGKPPYLE